MDDPALFKRHFASPTWAPWRVFLKALFALDMDGDDLRTFTACTGQTEAPTEPAREAWLTIGRRGGKSRVLACVAAYLACFKDWTPYLSAGERGYVLIVAADRRQARAIMNYLKAFIGETAMLAPLISGETSEQLELSNGVTLEVATCSFRTIRGRTVIAALLDEVAFWRDDTSSANPDVEVIAALRPAMASVPGSLLLAASSPYSRRGVLWKSYQRYFGKPGPVLAWKASTLTMNPTLPARVVEEAYADDPASASAEFGGEYRSDLEAFVTLESVEACVSVGVRERGPLTSHRYYGFIDPAGGSGTDSMTLAVAHVEGKLTVIDCIREIRPPFSPDAVVEEFASLLKRYKINFIQGDRFGGEWCREPFLTRGIRYEASAKPKSDLYRDLLPRVNSGEIDFLDHARLITQLVTLERRTARSGKDSIDTLRMLTMTLRTA
jgi:hypothetical protein